MQADDHQLTAAQREAVTTIDRSIGIIAGAGAGKTRVLVERCAYVVQTVGLSLSQLLAITFTDRAAQELRSRLFRRLPATLHAQLHGATITTFHGLATRILQQHAPRIGLPPHFGILNASAAEALCESAVRHVLFDRIAAGDADITQLLTCATLSQLQDRCQRLLGERWHLRQWWQSIAATADSGMPAPLAREEADLAGQIMSIIQQCETAYTSEKRRRHAVDFHDLEILLLDLFTQAPEIVADYQQQFRHIVVDEFQDTNPIQMAIIRHLFSAQDNVLCIVGDPKQSIYRFRGAVVDCFSATLQQIAQDGGQIITLPENFRSMPGIIDFVQSSCPALTAEHPMTPQRPPLGEPAVVPLCIPAAPDRRMAEADTVAAYLAQMIGHTSRSSGDIACLFPSHLAMPYYAAALRRRGIPYHTYGSRGLLEQRAVIDLWYAAIVVERWCTGTPDDATLLALLRTPLFGLDEDHCYRLCHGLSLPLLMDPLAIGDASNTGATISSDLLPPLHRALHVHPVLRTYFARWRMLAQRASPAELLREIVHDTQYDAVLCRLDPTGQQWHAVEQFIDLVDSETAQEMLTLTDLLRHLQQLRQRAARIGEQPVAPAGDHAVQLMTVHAAKGNEFPVVVLADLAARRPYRGDAWLFRPEFGLALRDLPSQEASEDPSCRNPRWDRLRREDRQAEQRESDRLLYVALTRAADQIILPVRQGNGATGECEPAAADDTMSWEARVLLGMRQQGIVPHEVADRDPLPMATPTERVDRAPAIIHHGRRRIPASHAPVHHTVTELETFDRCPEEYRLKYDMRLPGDIADWSARETMPAHLRGELVHAVLEHAACHPASDIAAVLRDVVRQRGLAPSIADDAEINRLLRVGLTMMEPRGTLLPEWPFHLYLAGTPPVILSGTIDLLRQTPDGWEIIDYKTDRFSSIAQAPQYAAMYALQMLTYALAATMAQYTPVVATTLYFLDCDHAIRTPVTAESLRRGTARIRQLIGAMTATDPSWTPPDNAPCMRCIYAHNRFCSKSKCPDFSPQM
ncbi:MAG: UvrD-helicase domain-containing protein [Deltaproteobacteria bacterium]|nr:UvrD-helicase domain-containing protein [Deltaproteobacteria bacterium]